MDDEEQPKTVPMGITADDLSDALDYWLKNPKQKARAISVSGEWGCGKTYAWNKYVESAKFKKHAYVSLFGAKSVDEVSFRLIADVFVPTVGEKQGWLSKGFQAILATGEKQAEKQMGGKFATIAAGMALDLGLKQLAGAVVAIDDIERRHPSLSIEEVLGFATRLKEYIGAHVVLILNEGELGDSKSRLSQFREKVLDSDFQLVLAPSDAARIGLKENSWAFEGAKDFAEKVGLCNIRIFERIDSILSRFNVASSSTPQPVLNRLAYSVTGIAWAHFCRREDVPTPEQLLEFHTFGAGVRAAAKKDLAPEPYEKTLSKLVWSSDDMDYLIYSVVKSGRLPTNEVAEQVARYLADNKRNESSARVDSAWRQYWSTLQDNSAEFVVTLHEASLGHIEFASLNQVNAAVKVLRELNRSDLANSLVDQQVAHWRAGHITRDTLESHYFHDPLDGYLDQETKKLPTENSTSLTVQSVLVYLSEQNGWNVRDEAFFLQLTREDWLVGLNELDVPDVARAIGAARNLYAYLKRDSRREISWDVSPLDEALKEIGAASTIGKMRTSVLLRD